MGRLYDNYAVVALLALGTAGCYEVWIALHVPADSCPESPAHETLIAAKANAAVDAARRLG